MLNELKFNEDIIINDFNELGKSQNEIEKENFERAESKINRVGTQI